MASRLGRRMLSAYSEAEPWKRAHDDAVLCAEVEEVIAYGVSLLRGLSSDDALWQDRVLSGSIPYRDEDRLRFIEDYREWSATSKKLLESADRVAGLGHPIRGLDSFREAVAEADCILGAAEIEADLPPAGEILHLADLGNPRPGRYGD